MVYCSYCGMFGHSIRKCCSPYLAQLVDDAEFWGLYSRIRCSNNKFNTYLQTLDAKRLRGLLAKKKVSSSGKNISELIKACIETYMIHNFMETNTIKNENRFNCWVKYSNYISFLNRNDISHDSCDLFFTLSCDGMNTFSKIFGDGIHISDIVNILYDNSYQAPTTLVNIKNILDEIANDIANKIFEYNHDGHIVGSLYERTKNEVLGSYHKDFRDFVQTSFNTQMLDDLENESWRIVDTLEEEYGEEFGEFEDVVNTQEIKSTILYDKNLVLSNEECYICSDNLCDTILNCNHTLCFSCIGTMITNARADHRVKFACPYCKEEIQKITTSREQKT